MNNIHYLTKPKEVIQFNQDYLDKEVFNRLKKSVQKHRKDIYRNQEKVLNKITKKQNYE